MKEYELFIPLNYNDGSPVEVEKLVAIRDRLLRQFGDLTFNPNPNLGFWRQGFLTFEDNIVVYKIVSKHTRQARTFFRHFKEELKAELRQEEIFVTEKDVKVL